VPKIRMTKNFVRVQIMPKSRCAAGSFRTKKLPKGRRLVVCCPKGSWTGRRCKVGTRGQVLLKPRKR